MDPVVSKTFDEMLKRMEDYDKRWGNLERRFDDASAALQEREEAVDARFGSLESFTSAQYTAAVVADNWGSHFDSRVSDLEQRMADLELIWLAEIQGRARRSCGDAGGSRQRAAVVAHGGRRQHR